MHTAAPQTGSTIHCIETRRFQGARMVRSAGTSAQVCVSHCCDLQALCPALFLSDAPPVADLGEGCATRLRACPRGVARAGGDAPNTCAFASCDNVGGRRSATCPPTASPPSAWCPIACTTCASWARLAARAGSVRARLWHARGDECKRAERPGAAGRRPYVRGVAMNPVDHPHGATRLPRARKGRP
jgi:hypothetical protein